MTKHKYLFALFSLLCCGIARLVIYGQATNQVASQPTNRVAAATPQVAQPQAAQEIPEQYLYRFFLSHLKHLEDKARNPNAKAGEDKLNLHYRQQLQLTEGEYQKLLKIANDCESEMSAHLVRRKEIINRLRSQGPGRQLASRDQIPPVPNEVKQLQKEFEAMLSKYANRVKLELSPGKVNQINAFLKREFAPQMKVLKMDVPRDRTPEKQRPPAFEK
ncbi:MAG TPA: hypothetical protein VFV58_40025 [Blastocatellia bacterium]|nr:hypothetical protein [Blastocatellia bacterium]